MNSSLSRLSGLYSHLPNRSFSPYWQAGAPQVLRWLELHPEDVVLEVGCGHGLWTSFIAPRVRATYACDIDVPAIRGAALWQSPREPYQPRACVGFVQASGTDLPFADTAFSKVLGVDVLEHIPDHCAMMGEIARVLKPDGRIVMTTLLRNRPAYIRKITFLDHVREYGTEDFQELFREVGLQIAQTFYFYYMPTTVARELNMLVGQSRIGKVVGVDLVMGPAWRLVCDIERLYRRGRPGGIGVVATKGEQTQHLKPDAASEGTRMSAPQPVRNATG